MKNKLKSYSFWTALAGSAVVFVSAIGKFFGFSVEGEIVSNIVMAIAGVLVLFGVVTMPPKNEGDQNATPEETEELKEINHASDETKDEDKETSTKEDDKK